MVVIVINRLFFRGKWVYFMVKQIALFIYNYIVSLRWLFKELSISDQISLIKGGGLIFYYRSLSVRFNYHRVIRRLKKEKTHRKIRVCFLVSETSKWNMQSLYDMLLESEDFYPFIVVTNFMITENRQSYDHIVNFYKGTAKEVKKGWNEESRSGIDLKTFSPDIVFYQQPWGLFDNQDVLYVSQFALTFSISYAIEDSYDAMYELMDSFYSLLTKYFVFSNYTKEYFLKKVSYALTNFVTTGHPKLEVYNDYIPENYKHSYVIYAPHHSFAHSFLNYGTFPWSGKYILDWAKSHQGIRWIFKPHPRLKVALLEEGIMNQNEIDEYYHEWAKLGFFYDDGNYFELFKESRCMITDCGSFLTEYLPTQMPVIHLRNNDSKEFSPTNSIIIESYYKAYNIDELSSLLEEVVIHENDPMKNERCQLISQFNLINASASERIINVLRSLFS